MGSGVKEDFLEEVMWWRALKAEQNFISRRDVTCSLKTGHSRVFRRATGQRGWRGQAAGEAQTE